MKHILLLISITWTLFCAVTACNKEQSPCDRVTGTWETTFGPKSVYTFEYGTCTIISPIDTTTRSYACEGQEMKLGGLEVELTSDSTLLIRTLRRLAMCHFNVLNFNTRTILWHIANRLL